MLHAAEVKVEETAIGFGIQEVTSDLAENIMSAVSLEGRLTRDGSGHWRRRGTVCWRIVGAFQGYIKRLCVHVSLCVCCWSLLGDPVNDIYFFLPKLRAG